MKCVPCSMQGLSRSAVTERAGVKVCRFHEVAERDAEKVRQRGEQVGLFADLEPQRVA